jgi:3-hydroxybutyrate dehydrogenase
MSLKGKVAIITGSTSGIGLGIARSLAAEGANVVLNARSNSPEIEVLRAGIEKDFGVQAIFVAADMAQAEEIRSLAKQTEERFGKVDIIVNNAGIQFVCPIVDFPEDKWEQILSINLTSAFHLIKAVLPGMQSRKWGRILNVASAHGLTASPFKSAYVAAKHGMVGLTRTVALETAEHGITVNTICPGYVLTPLVEKQIADQAKTHNIPPENVVRDVMLVHQARKEFVKVEELGALAVFLCGDAAASMTGTALPMDGGWTLH